MKVTNIIAYIIAFFFPPIWFTVLTDNSNELHPAQPYILCSILFAGAGLVAAKGFPSKNRIKWIAISILVGIAEAFGLTVLV